MENRSTGGNGLLAIYDRSANQFTCSAPLLEIFGVAAGETPELPGFLEESERGRFDNILLSMGELSGPSAYQTQFRFRDGAGRKRSFQVAFVSEDPQRQVILAFQEDTGSGTGSEYDGSANRLTGLMTREMFCARLDRLETAAGAVVYFDVQRFKVINNIFGMAEGDRLLRHIADRIRANLTDGEFGCQINADRFAIYARGGRTRTDRLVNTLFDEIANLGLPFEILCNAGVYLMAEPRPSAVIALDYAAIAQKAVKGSFNRRIHYFSDELQKNLLGTSEIAGMMRKALLNRQFVVYYQPQYDHSTKMMVGAEALIRWIHPEKGLILPSQFIPVFESTGFISQVDAYVFEEVCAFLHRCLEQSVAVVPISVNLTRYDLFTPGYLERLEAIRKKYGVPTRYLRIELTESAVLDAGCLINEALSTLHHYGYTVEMDDFGSGYSSLSTLKELDFDTVKLDMRFFHNARGSSGRAGVILSSVVRMVNWLRLSLIAEGVEEAEQADFLRSIGCDYIQGYLYSRPLPEAEFETLLRGSHTGLPKPHLDLVKTMDPSRFWSEESLETLIFSNYVGGAAILDVSDDGKAEILRVNEKYLRELGMNLSENEIVYQDPRNYMDTASQSIYAAAMDKALQTGEEQECETWRTIVSHCCGEERVCIRSTMRAIGHSRSGHILYVMIRNITAEKRYVDDMEQSERRFMAASEQVNIYCWEYTVATHEMRPCFRCMRDLGLPALLTNYPDSAIEMGVFPPEIADEYREWIRKIDAGEAATIEGILPLTVGRVPFHVRYTTEFDESGKPVKAYGSAALVLDREKP